MMARIGDPEGPVRSTKVLAVEGADERKFLEALFDHMRIPVPDIRAVGGRDLFPAKIPALKIATGFSGVTHFGIIRDKNAGDALTSVKNILQRCGFSPPERHAEFSSGSPKVGIFIMPGKTVDGTMLEDLCLRTVADAPAMECVNDFASCVQRLENGPKNISKAKTQVFRAQVFLATRAETVDAVGLGGKKHYWNFDCRCLGELKQFLAQLA